ncbi:MAG: hypothetical protein IT559_08750 [Alphaproteobacteria bacterium]|nr:hypothetical protein [Alphaproteobacteria bacterium]
MSSHSTKIAGTLSLLFTMGPPAISVAAPPASGLSQSFKMQVQHRPVTHPKDPAHRIVEVDCRQLMRAQNGSPVMTGGFADQFDVPPLRVKPAGIVDKTPQEAQMDGVAAISHLGSRLDEKHQLCVAQAELYTNKAIRQQTPHQTIINGKSYFTTVPPGEDRYCPPVAALKFCTGDPALTSTISPVYRFNEGTNTLEIVPGNL